MNPQNEKSKNSQIKNPKEFTRDKTEFGNTERDEGTLGVHQNKKNDPKFADQDQPEWQPPESQPEPRPVDPIMNSTQQSSPNNPNTHSPT